MAITPETRDYRTFEVRALPQEARLCTVPGTEEVINRYMTRKV